MKVKVDIGQQVKVWAYQTLEVEVPDGLEGKERDAAAVDAAMSCAYDGLAVLGNVGRQTATGIAVNPGCRIVGFDPDSLTEEIDVQVLP